MLAARLRSLLLLAALPLSWGCGPEETTAQRTIVGEVVDAQTGDGIARASVEFVSDTLEETETVTDGDGRFTLHVDVTNGVLFGHVTASHPDYAPAPAASVYFDDIEHLLTVQLYPGARE